MRLSNSKLKVYRRCPKQYEYKYVRRLKRKQKAIQLERGSWIHDLLMTHYDGHDWREKHAEKSKEFYKLFEEEREHLGDLPTEVERIMRSYFAYYRDEDKRLRVIDSELDEVLPLPNGDEFNFIIDLIVEEPDGGIWLWDHKTVKSFMPESFMLIDTQLARYFWAAEKMGYTPLRGVMFNEIITASPTLPEILKSGGLSKRKNIRCDAYTYLRYVKELGLDPNDYRDILGYLKPRLNQWFRRTSLPRDTNLTRTLMEEMSYTSREIQDAERLGQFPRTPDKSCTWGCDFLEVCQLELAGGDPSDIIRIRFTEDRKEV